jgi:hypothetical protein
MHRSFAFALVSSAIVALVACGGTESQDSSDATADGGDASADSHFVHDDGIDVVRDTGHDTFVMPDTYVDPGCGDAKPPPILAFDCDPFAKPTTCPSGQACYPYAIPASDPCSPETYGASCYPAGTGTQGTPCDGGASECAPGYFCVVSGGGTICAAACKVGVPGACKEGLICSPTDVPGVGACN